MRVDIPIRFVFLGEMAKHPDDERVLQHVGVISRMEGVAVTEHGERPAEGNRKRVQGKRRGTSGMREGHSL
ncbi:hypothetical protein YK56LOC_54120 [Caballeronia sp. HLA56]